MPQDTRLDIYKVLERCALLIAGFAIITFAVASIPNRASAFWPFSTLNADAAVDTYIPSSTTPVLIASVNSNPNADVPISLTISGDSALIPHSGPIGTITDIGNTPPPDRISVYVVRPGDTLSDIAGMFGVSVNTIIWANNLTNARDVHPGETLVILPISGIERTIVKGDTLKSIAKKYNADAEEIAQYNGLDPTEPLALNSTIIIPGGEFAAPSAPATQNKRNPRTIREPYLGGGGSAQPGYYMNPIPGGIITQGLHGWNGIDIGAGRGTPIHAAADGTVIIARNNGGWNGGYGNYVVIAHENGSQTLYSHMKNAIVSSGQYVSAGQTIGYVGSTGLSTGPHLHLEVRGAANPFRNCTVGTACSPQ
ncbi:MAG: peptidoglycan DD-metalloendopeptidase family protein [bacterium]|nr:peptidoglycan DD-metalloendopeptidase family protein [bacterium]MDO8742234.1 peptidoglycan DD-metalloendopeptidase family protein [bacterium]